MKAWRIFTGVFLLAMPMAAGCKQKPQQEAAGAEATKAPAAELGSAVIHGLIRFRGKPPARTLIRMNAQPYCVPFHPNGQESDDVVLNENGRLRDVIVYVSGGLPPGAYPVPSQPVTIEQVGCWYKPHVLALMVGQPLEVVNGDDTMHNIHGRPAKNKSFNFSQPSKGMKRQVVFDTPELPIPVKCDVHGWMSAFLGVFPDPFHSVSQEDGSYTISGLPAGMYQVTAWHEKEGTQTTQVTVTAGETKQVDFAFGAPAK